mmetsp:Transcript_35245/g.105292  ORF Transcript_35245/g.105292 Transcript_35245/m.105292 type:complete len:81 (-) Transcript_35245:59-301(-)
MLVRRRDALDARGGTGCSFARSTRSNSARQLVACKFISSASKADAGHASRSLALEKVQLPSMFDDSQVGKRYLTRLRSLG